MVGVYFMGGYYFTNHVHFFSLHYFPMLFGEEYLPFLVWSNLIYFSCYLLIGLSLFGFTDHQRFLMYIRAMFITLTISFLVFILFPVTFPRYAISEIGLTPFGALVMRTFYMFDTPANCFPSLHVSMSFLAAFSMYHRNKKRFQQYLLWAILISISTLTLKQHYLLDIAGGLFLAGAVWTYSSLRFNRK